MNGYTTTGYAMDGYTELSPDDRVAETRGFVRQLELRRHAAATNGRLNRPMLDLWRGKDQARYDAVLARIRAAEAEVAECDLALGVLRADLAALAGADGGTDGQRVE